MNVIIKGRSYFTEDGFDVKVYDKKTFDKALYKVLGDVVFDKQIQIIGSRDEKEKSSAVNIITYHDKLNDFTDSETFLERFKIGNIFPDIDGIIWHKESDNIAVIGYGNNKIYLDFESENSEYIAFFAITLSNLSESFEKIIKTVSKLLGNDIKVTVHCLKKRNEILFNHFKDIMYSKYNINVLFEYKDYIHENEFEYYCERENKNVVVISGM